jgi:hypothetical protein
MTRDQRGRSGDKSRREAENQKTCDHDPPPKTLPGIGCLTSICLLGAQVAPE